LPDREESADMAVDDVEYEPVSVKAVLAEMKDTAELLIDLSYSAVLLGSDAVAGEVLELEERMDVLQMQARMSLLMAARNPEDAEALAPVLGHRQGRPRGRGAPRGDAERPPGGRRDARQSGCDSRLPACRALAR
jgi:hypothetical protein